MKKVTELNYAREHKLKYYFTGKPCKYGHTVQRLTLTRSCVICTKVRKNKDAQKYRDKNKEQIRIKMLEYSKKNRSLVNQRAKISRDKAYAKDPQRMKALRRSQVALRRARKLQATPLWSDLQAIKEFYLNCPPLHHVDHIVPLAGKTVCGLHVLENLQYLPIKENLSKGNKF